jgi:hypothetical protein
VLPNCCEQSLRQGGQSDFFRSTFEEPHGTATKHTTSYEAVVLRPAHMSREATPRSNKEVASDVVAHCAQEGIKGSNKQRKQRPPGTTTSRNDGRDWEAGSSGVRCISITAHSNMRLARPPIDHFKRLLEEACPNHAYPIMHKLKDCGVMQSFITSGSLT